MPWQDCPVCEGTGRVTTGISHHRMIPPPQGPCPVCREIDRLKELNQNQHANLSMVTMLLANICDVLDGDEVSDFAESFPSIRQAVDLMAECNGLRAKNEALVAALLLLKEELNDPFRIIHSPGVGADAVVVSVSCRQQIDKALADASAVRG